MCSDSLASLPVLETLELTEPNVELVLDEVRLPSVATPALC